MALCLGRVAAVEHDEPGHASVKVEVEVTDGIVADVVEDASGTGCEVGGLETDLVRSSVLRVGLKGLGHGCSDKFGHRFLTDNTKFRKDFGAEASSASG